MSIGEAFDPRCNSIGAMRLICAALVVVGHAFSYGGYGQDPLLALTNNQVAIGRWPVDVFFVLSGFLLTSSFERQPLAVYARNRFLRIYPAYWVCLIVCGIVLPLLFGLSPDLAFVIGGLPLILYVRQEIPGLFEGNFENDVNGALWTLPVELACYISLWVVSRLGLLNRRGILVTFGGLLAAYWLQILLNDGSSKLLNPISSPLRLASFFYAGVALYMWRDRVPVSGALAGVCAGFLLAFTIAGTALPFLSAGAFYMSAPVLLSYLTLYGAVRLGWTRLNTRTDVSYGVYIYGTPALQVLTAYGLHVDAINYPVYVMLAFVLTLPLALASWFFVEKPAMNLKKGKRPISVEVVGAP